MPFSNANFPAREPASAAGGRTHPGDGRKWFSALPPARRLAWAFALALAGAAALSGAPGRAATPGQRVYSGACDASAVAEVNAAVFAAASDESAVLRLYRRGAGGAPLREVPLAGFLGGGRHEPDLEGGARVGDRVYWIGSHSRNEQGEARPERHVLFATELRGTGTSVTLAPVGRPYRGLVSALDADPRLAVFGFGAGARRSGEARGGLNIEGLAAGPDGALWVAFRNPVPEGRAVVVPLLNPAEVTGPSPVPARFGPPLRLKLGGDGIRDLVRAGTGWLVVGGPAEGGGRHRVYAWSGTEADPVEISKGVPKGFQAEGILPAPGGGAGGELFSDDGGMKLGGVRCEDLRDPAARQFRSATFGLP